MILGKDYFHSVKLIIVDLNRENVSDILTAIEKIPNLEDVRLKINFEEGEAAEIVGKNQTVQKVAAVEIGDIGWAADYEEENIVEIDLQEDIERCEALLQYLTPLKNITEMQLLYLTLSDSGFRHLKEFPRVKH